MRLYIKNPQTYPQVFVDIAESTTVGCTATARVPPMLRRANLPQREALPYSRPAKYPITIRKHVVRHHSGRRLAHLVPAPRLSHRPCPDHRALGLAARQQDHPAAAL